MSPRDFVVATLLMLLVMFGGLMLADVVSAAILGTWEAVP